MYEIFVQLCEKNNVSAYKICKEIGISQGTISNWKNGRSGVSRETLIKIANYFNVSTDYLLGNYELTEDQKYYLNDETAEIAQKIFENKDMRVLFDVARDASPEDLQTVYTMLLALKKKEKGNQDV